MALDPGLRRDDGEGLDYGLGHQVAFLQPATHAPLPRMSTTSPDNTRWTGAKAAAFLKALASHGKVAAAARSVGMSRQAAYRLRARAPKFAEMWDWAMREARAKRAAEREAARKVHPLLARGPVRPPGDTSRRKG